MPFDESNSTNIWEECSIRKWLNSNFYDTAFSEVQKNYIILTDVDNSESQDYSYWSKGGSCNTNDRVFLLSYTETCNYHDIIMQHDNYTTAFCRERLTFHSSNMTPEEIKSCSWWKRSPGPLPVAAIKGGYTFANMYIPYEKVSNYSGVRPAIVLDLGFLAAHPEYLDSAKQDVLVETASSNILIWGQEYIQDDLTYSFGQEGTLSYYSLRGNDSDTLVNAVTSNAIPGTEKINQKIQEIMQACNYETPEGELDGVRTELYGSQESDAFVMATYGDWGVNMMLFVDGTTGIADYFSGTISTEDDAKSSSNGSLFGSAMQKARQDTSKTRQFSLTAKEYIDAFNKQYGNMGMTLVPDSSRDDCHLAIRGEPTDIRIQFCDKINGPWTTGSGLDMKEWNWLYAYIATDDYSVDVEYFASFPMMCSFFAAIVGCDYTQEEFMDNCNASGPNGYPILTYTKNGIKNEIQFRDASVGNYHQTVYSASVELVQ